MKKTATSGFYVMSLIAVCCFLYAGYGLFLAPDEESRDDLPRQSYHANSRVSTPEASFSLDATQEQHTELSNDPEDQESLLTASESEDLEWQLARARSRLRQQRRQEVFGQDQKNADSSGADAFPSTPDNNEETVESEDTRIYHQIAEVTVMKLKSAIDACTRIAYGLPDRSSVFSNITDDERSRMRGRRKLKREKQAMDLQMEELPAPPDSYEAIDVTLRKLYKIYKDFYRFVRLHSSNAPRSDRKLEQYIRKSTELYDTLLGMLVEKKGSP